MAVSVIKGKQDSGWNAVGSGAKYRVINGICFLVILGLTAGTTAVLVGTLPTEARPTESVIFTPRAGTNACAGWIDSAGRAYVQAPSNNLWVQGSVCFPIG